LSSSSSLLSLLGEEDDFQDAVEGKAVSYIRKVKMSSGGYGNKGSKMGSNMGKSLWGSEMFKSTVQGDNG
jgi:hypothetical protein